MYIFRYGNSCLTEKNGAPKIIDIFFLNNKSKSVTKDHMKMW